MKVIFKAFLVAQLAILPFVAYSQNNVKIKPAQRNVVSKWGYQDLFGEWIIHPQFSRAYDFNEDGIAEVIIDNHYQPTVWGVGNNIQMAFIDLNGDILIKYQYGNSQNQKNKKYDKALQIVSRRKIKGKYNNFYARLSEVDANIIVKEQKEQTRRDSVLMAQKLQKIRVDSAVATQRAADSLRLAKERKVANMSSGAGLSLKKVKVTGHGLLLSKDEAWREYTIQLDDFNRLFITHEGDTRLQGELDVLKVIYESDWGLLADDLFHSIEITKATTEISRGVRTQKYGIFSFLITLNLDNLDITYTEKEANSTVLNAISQVERYITSFMKHYQSSAHFVEPLFQVKVGGREGISVGIVDKKGNGASMEDVKRICTETRRKLSE
ncbi:WG repeat-containing protein [Parabacteroides faecis]|uniref:WG repeat-containing protein n=1 Tax=Parabacteroides faecis TaxID=1217282 RepID=A0ABR6KF92_9BACT|nr:WG repeat-containing protein [Parabacteroides faecis]MBB4620169.1 hypothetical protein [Parabacteroides faecis]GGJ95448.1 hypothetical protein GCM10007084_18840 [Parabacteroides faecis]